MNCSDHQRTINRFIDHEVRATECAELFEHLGKCTECRRFYDTIITLGAELDKVHASTEEIAEASWQSSVAARYSHLVSPTTGGHRQQSVGASIRTFALAVLVVILGCLVFSTTIAVDPSRLQTTAPIPQLNPNIGLR